MILIRDKRPFRLWQEVTKTALASSRSLPRRSISNEQQFSTSLSQHSEASSQSSQYTLGNVATPKQKQGTGVGQLHPAKERLVILGSGWGAMTLLKNLDQVCTGEVEKNNFG